MKKKYILLMLMVLLLFNGCKKQEEQISTQESTDCITIDDTEDKEVEEPLETSPKEEEVSKVESEQTEHKDNNQEEQKETPPPTDKTDTTKKVEVENSTSKESIPQESEKTPRPVKDYNPNTIVKLATDKLKEKGKITLTDNLDRLLAEGSITQEEYNEYYPYDGAGYYSVFMETNLYDAKTTSGRKLSSEEEIAEHIAEMLAIEPGPYFLIEYAGVYTTGGNDFYEFRCYRA